MAGRFNGLSDLEWQRVAEMFPPAPPRRSRGRPHTPFRKGVNTWLDVLSTGCRWGDLPRGPQGHACGHASPSPRHRRGTWDDSMAVRGGRQLVFPLAQAAVKAWPMAAKGTASSSPVSPTRPAYPGRTRPRRRRGVSAPRACRCWTQSPSEPAGLDAPESVPTASPPIQGLMPQTCASHAAPEASGPRSRHGSGRPRSHGGHPSRSTYRVFKRSERWPGVSRSIAV